MSRRAPARAAALFALAALGGQPAAETLSVSGFLRGALAETSSLSRPGSGTPFLRDAEIRVRNEAFDLSNQRYSLRLSPKGWGESSAAGALSSATAERGAAALARLRNEALKERYRVAVDWMAARALGDLHAELARLEEERIRVLGRRSVSDDFDIGDLLRAENALTRHMERRAEALAVASSLLERARELAGSTALEAIDTGGIPGLDVLMARLDAPAGDADNVHLLPARRELEAARAQQRLATAGNRRLISFLEFGYDHGRRRAEIADRDSGNNHDLDRAYTIEVGFRLPWPGGDADNVRRRTAELAHREAELHRDRAGLEAEARGLRSTLRVLAARHGSLEEREAQLDVPARLRRYAGLGAAADPVVLLSLRQAAVENTLRREEVRFEFLRGYLDAADLAGDIARRPARNLLSGGMEALE